MKNSKWSHKRSHAAKTVKLPCQPKANPNAATAIDIAANYICLTTETLSLSSNRLTISREES